MSGPTDIAGKIKDVTAALAKADAELKWEMAATAADVAGMVDPTPVSDLVGAGLSLRKGDFLGAGLSVASMVPYVGDALAKPVKAVRATKAIVAIEKKIAGLTKTLNGLRKAEKEAQAVEAAAKEAKAASEAAAKAKPPKSKEAAEQQQAAAKDGKAKDCEDCAAAGAGKKSETSAASGNETKAGGGAKSTGMPAWLKERFAAGNEFNHVNRARYPYNEVEVTDVAGNKFRVDSYNPVAGEIVSRKLTQLSEVKPETGVEYLRELGRKYPDGASISDSVFNPRVLQGQRLSGTLILEVPVQNGTIPKAVLDYANNNGMIIRDVNGVVH